MIDITVDEAYAFDYLSILEVKKNRNPVQFIIFFDCSEKIAAQVGKEYFDAIIGSKQYRKLVDTNQKIFDYIEMIRNGENIPAYEIDDLNTVRYNLKTDLQRIFFKSEMALEKKTI